MTTTTTISTYDFTTGLYLDIRPLLRMLDPTEVPLQSGMGADSDTVLTFDNCFEKKVEWQDDELLPGASTLTAAMTNVVATMDVVVADRIGFGVGDWVLVGSEIIQIDAYNATDGRLDVTRGVAGTTAAAHSIGDNVINYGRIFAEASTPGVPRSQDWNNRFNITQILGPTQVAVSGTEQAIRKYGLENTTQFDYQLSLRAIEEMILLEHSLLYGTRFEDTTAKKRLMGGMTFYIASNVVGSGTVATFNQATNADAPDDFLDLAQTLYGTGGRPDRCLVNGVNKRHISKWDSSDIRLGRSDLGRGQIVDFYESDFSRISMILHRRLRTQDAILFSRDQAAICTLRPWQFKMLADTGDFTSGQIVGEFTLRFEAERWAGRFNGLS